MNYRTRIIASLAAVLTISGCAGNPESSLANRCEDGLKHAYRELDYAKANGIRSGIALTKATTLLLAASTQAEFGKYPNCIDKVKRARAYIRTSRK